MRITESQPENTAREARGLTAEQYQKLTSYLARKYGLRLAPEKKMMFESRFLRRLNMLGLSSFTEYVDTIFETNSNEYKHFVDLVTTHKTFFFREDYQFEFLKKLLPEYARRGTTQSTVRTWSAGCSTGEEVYTLGIVFNEMRKDMPHFDFRITGTDISIPSLQKASRGMYSANELQDVPPGLLNKYFKSTRGDHPHLVFSNAEVTNRITLGVLNLNNANYKLDGLFDFIFCRNVIIYFDLQTQRRVLEKLVSKLKPGGYLFLGHSETAIGSSLPIKSIRPTIYQKI